MLGIVHLDPREIRKAACPVCLEKSFGFFARALIIVPFTGGILAAGVPSRGE